MSVNVFITQVRSFKDIGRTIGNPTLGWFNGSRKKLTHSNQVSHSIICFISNCYFHSNEHSNERLHMHFLTIFQWCKFAMVWCGALQWCGAAHCNGTL